MRDRTTRVRKLLTFTVPLAIVSACGGSTDPKASATQVNSVAGELQVAAPNAAVTTPPTVKVIDAQGNGVGGVTVNFAPSAAGSVVAGGTQTSGSDGIAKPDSWTLGKAPGRYTLRATSTGLRTLTFYAMASATSVFAGGNHTCALVTGGAAFCWGANTSGQLGIGSLEARTLPSAVAGEMSFTSLALGGSHTCGLTSAGAAHCWGNNSSGQLGDGTTTNRNAPTAVGGGLTFQSLVTGDQHTCGRTAAGVTHCWGLNSTGQLGDGTTTNKSSPTAVTGGLTFASLGAGAFHTCGVTAVGAAHCWGQNTNGQIGDGSTTDRSVPTAVSGGLTFTTVGGGAVHTCGLITGGSARCWGHNGNGEAGDNSSGNDRLTPVAVQLPTGVALQSLAVGGRLTEAVRQGHACGLTSTGVSYCWGHNGFAQLGDRSTSLRLVAVASTVVLGGDGSYQQIVAGDSHACARASNGVLYCWGRNNLGQLGTATGTNSVNTGTRVVAVP